MEIKITNFEKHLPKNPVQPGDRPPSKKGTFGFTATMDDSGRNVVIEINKCQYFDNGKSRWITYPEKRKPGSTAHDKWEHEYFYAGIIEPNDDAKTAILGALSDYLAQEQPF